MRIYYILLNYLQVFQCILSDIYKEHLGTVFLMLGVCSLSPHCLCHCLLLPLFGRGNFGTAKPLLPVFVVLLFFSPAMRALALEQTCGCVGLT